MFLLPQDGQGSAETVFREEDAGAARRCWLVVFDGMALVEQSFYISVPLRVTEAD